MEIEYSKAAMKSIRKLDGKSKNRIWLAIEKIPMGDIKKLSGYEAYFRLRVGEYRVIFEFTKNGLFISDIKPRGDAYKNL